MSKFISFEGVDGSGKTTLIQVVSELLTTNGYTVKVIHEPGTTPIGLKIRELLKSDIPRSKMSEVLLFEASRADMVETEVIPSLEKYDFVITDRYVDSTIAYQGYGNGNPIDVLTVLNDIAIQGIKPDMRLYIDVSVDVAESRRNTRDSDVDKFDNDNEFANRVYAGYQELIHEGVLLSIDNNRDLSVVAKEIFELITHNPMEISNGDFMIKYPTHYTHMRKDQLTTALVKDAALIMFMSDDHWRYGNMDEIMAAFNVVKSAKDAIIVYIDDIDVSRGHSHGHELSDDTYDSIERTLAIVTPTHIRQIMLFLQHHSDDNVIFACDAGVSRSGFGRWFLDVKNGKYDNMKAIDDTFRNIKSDYRYIANAEMVRLSWPYLTEAEKQKLDNIRRTTRDLPVDLPHDGKLPF